MTRVSHARSYDTYQELWPGGTSASDATAITDKEGAKSQSDARYQPEATKGFGRAILPTTMPQRALKGRHVARR